MCKWAEAEVDAEADAEAEAEAEVEVVCKLKWKRKRKHSTMNSVHGRDRECSRILDGTVQRCGSV